MKIFSHMISVFSVRIIFYVINFFFYLPQYFQTVLFFQLCRQLLIAVLADNAKRLPSNNISDLVSYLRGKSEGIEVRSFW